MRTSSVYGILLLQFAASRAVGDIVYNNLAPSNEFVTTIASIYFDDATLASSGAETITQFDLAYENLSGSTGNFDLLVQFYNSVNYGAVSGAPVGTSPIGSLIDITGLSVAGGQVGQSGLISLQGTLPVSTTGTIGYEFELVSPGATSFSESNVDSSVVPVFRSGAPSVGTSSPFFAYDYLNQNDIVGDSRSGDIWTFPTPSNVSAEIGGVAAPAVTAAPGEPFVLLASSISGISITSFAGVSVDSGAMATIAPATNQSNRRLVVVNSPGLLIAGSIGDWTGSLDLSNNDLDLPGASLATITNQIHQGYANGNWNGSDGIRSSSAAGDTTHLTALGVIQNNQSGSALYTAFDGQPVGSSDILVKYTYYGDTNLDGIVDGTDYSRIDAAYLSKSNPTGWFNGDFNYDGVIDGSDYTLIDNAFNAQGASLAGSIAPAATITAEIATAPLPEPSALWVFPLIGIGTFVLRRGGKLTGRRLFTGQDNGALV